jgi:hypothetical protein
MGCLIVMLAAAAPRLVIALLWGFTERMTIAFNSGWVAVFGFVFMPYTSVMWALAYAPIKGVSGLGYLFVAFGFLCDIGSHAGGGQQAYARRA